MMDFMSLKAIFVVSCMQFNGRFAKPFQYDIWARERRLQWLSFLSPQVSMGGSLGGEWVVHSGLMPSKIKRT